MSFHLSPMYHNNWARFQPYNMDLRRVQDLIRGERREGADVAPPTVEPSYSFEANDKTARFEIEMPGVLKEDIQIEVAGRRLVVKGQRFKKAAVGLDVNVDNASAKSSGKRKDKPRRVEEAKSEKAAAAKSQPKMVYVMEARLGNHADLDAINADMDGSGILTVNVPMQTEKAPRKVQIGM